MQSLVSKVGSRGGGAKTMSELKDHALLARIARSRDREAFAELFRRYETRAANLAFHLTGKREMAEDAVQEAMVRVWRSAETFRGTRDGEGSVSGWVLRIVAREALKRLRRERKEDRIMDRERDREQQPRAAPPHKNAEREELLGSLRESLGRLPDLHRRLVALRFAAGLSLREIGEAESMPETTVSYKIDDALKKLRVQLQAAGWAAAVPLLNAEGLSEAVCSGPGDAEVPVDRILARVDALDNAAKSSESIRAAVLVGSRGAWAMASVLLIGATAGAGLWFANVDRTKVAEQTPTVATSGLQWPRVWTFEEGPPQDLKVVYGAWKWVAADETRRSAMAVHDDVWVRFPAGLPDGPLCVTLNVRRIEGKGKVWFGTNWVDGSYVLPRVCFNTRSLPKSYTDSNVLKFYIWGRRHATLLNGRLCQIIEYDRSYPMEMLLFAVGSTYVERVAVREVGVEEIPKAARASDLRSTGLFTQPERWLGFEWGTIERARKIP